VDNWANAIDKDMAVITQTIQLKRQR
jgi:hypothetical protein